MVVCWRTAADTTAAWRVLFIVLVALSMKEVEVALIAAVVLGRIWGLLHGWQSAATPSWRQSNRPISPIPRVSSVSSVSSISPISLALTHRNRGECDAAHAEGRRRGCRVGAQVVDLGVETCNLILILLPPLECLRFNIRNRSSYAHKFLRLLLH